MFYTVFEKQFLFVNPFYWWMSLYIVFWIPEVIQPRLFFLKNLSLYLLTFFSGPYIFRTEFIASKEFFVTEITFLHQVSKYWASIYQIRPTQNFPGQSFTSLFQKHWICWKVDQQIYLKRLRIVVGGQKLKQ